MAIFYFLAFILLFFGAQFKRHGYFTDCLDKEQTNAIKGFFILLVFISHCIQTIKGAGFTCSDSIDSLGLRIQSEFDQLIVVMFLFYSGYGVMESYMKKGKDYVKSFPRKRILTTLLNFDIAVSLFIILDTALGIRLGVKQTVLSLLAWESVGNSNWYIFVILFCYLSAYCGFILAPNHNTKSALVVLLIVSGGVLALSYKKPAWWYNTMLCFPAGVWFSIGGNRVFNFLQKYFTVMLGGTLCAFLLMHFIKLPGFHGLTYNLKSILFAVIIVLMTMKIKPGNSILQWLGVRLFPLYIYQRIPMIAISRLTGDEFVCNYRCLFIIVCLIVTCLFAYGYRYWQVKLS